MFNKNNFDFLFLIRTDQDTLPHRSVRVKYEILSIFLEGRFLPPAPERKHLSRALAQASSTKALVIG